jgi:hypothetical protein
MWRKIVATVLDSSATIGAFLLIAFAVPPTVAGFLTAQSAITTFKLLKTGLEWSASRSSNDHFRQQEVAIVVELRAIRTIMELFRDTLFAFSIGFFVQTLVEALSHVFHLGPIWTVLITCLTLGAIVILLWKYYSQANSVITDESLDRRSGS